MKNTDIGNALMSKSREGPGDEVNLGVSSSNEKLQLVERRND